MKKCYSSKTVFFILLEEHFTENPFINLFTNGQFDIFRTGFALDVATPVKFALATLLDPGLDCVVP